MEKNLCRYIRNVYFNISNLGLSAGISHLSTLGKFQHSVIYQEALLALDLLFRLCDQFQCADIPELFKTFFIHDYWRRQTQAIFLPVIVTPHFEIAENVVSCTLADPPKKGCISCQHFDECEFPRSISADDLSEANWRCFNCGNPLEFQNILFQTWLVHKYHVQTQFLCCNCFMEYSLTEEMQKDLGQQDLLRIPKPAPLLPENFTLYPNNKVESKEWEEKDLVVAMLGLVSIIAVSFDDPASSLYYKVQHPIPQDEIAWEAMQIIYSHVTPEKLDSLVKILPNVLLNPRLNELFEYCLTFLDLQDFILQEEFGVIKVNFSYKTRDFFEVFIKSPHVHRIVSKLHEDSSTWENINSWISTSLL